MVLAAFDTCLVCGADILAVVLSEEIPMCSTHSERDKFEALLKLERRIELTRNRMEYYRNSASGG